MKNIKKLNLFLLLSLIITRQMNEETQICRNCTFKSNELENLLKENEFLKKEIQQKDEFNRSLIRLLQSNKIEIPISIDGMNISKENQINCISASKHSNEVISEKNIKIRYLIKNNFLHSLTIFFIF